MLSFEDALESLLAMVYEMSPYLLLGFLVAGVLHAFVPQSLYNKHLARPSFGSVVRASLFGIPLPLCSCGVIPTAMSLRRSGASKGATVAFLISTPQTGVDSILATWSMLGAPFALLRPVVALFTSLFGGELVNRFDGGVVAEQQSPKAQLEPKSFAGRCVAALRYGYIDMMQDIGKWLVVGLLIAGAITIFVPTDFFSALSERPLFNMVVVLLFSIPMYLCATGSIPIAAALMLKGLTPGAALVLLMAGPATNMAAILVIRNVLGKRSLLLYLFSIIAGAMAFGLLVDYALPREWFVGGIVAESCAGCIGGNIAQVAWWKVASAILFTLLLVAAFVAKLSRKATLDECPECVVSGSAKEIHLKVSGMRCNHCKANVERAVTLLDGVESVSADIEHKSLCVRGSVRRDEIVECVEKLGFKVEE